MKKLSIIIIALFAINTQAQDSCSGVTTKTDKFSGDVHYQSPIGDNVSVHKYVKTNDTMYVLFINTYVSRPSYYKTGVTILLDNGSKLEYPTQEIGCKYSANGLYRMSAFMLISESDIDSLKSNIITDIRLYIHDLSLKAKEAQKVKGYVNCLINK
jgi:hypothetical protein